MRLLYCEPEVDNYRFVIYHPHYKEDNPADVKTKAVPKFGIEKHNLNK